MVSDAEVEFYRRRNAAAWFRDGAGAEGHGGDPFEPLPGQPGFHRIRQRADGACGFLSPTNRCRIHEELGAGRKPLTCRVFPYSFHPAADGVVVGTSFGCPTIVANHGDLIASGDSLIAIESLRKEWFAAHSPPAGPLELVAGRPIDTRSARVLREGLLAMLKRDGDDIRDNISRIAGTLDDLTRSRVLSLADADFAEYILLTVPHAVAATPPPAHRQSGAVGRLLQYGFLYTVTAVRAELDTPGQSQWGLRLRRLQLLAHFHGLARGRDRVNVRTLTRQRVDLNAPAIRPMVENYLRATIATLGAQGRPIVDELAIAVSYLNAATALAVMNAGAAGKTVDAVVFREALMEAADVSRARHAFVDWAVRRFGAAPDALWVLAAVRH